MEVGPIEIVASMSLEVGGSWLSERERRGRVHTGVVFLFARSCACACACVVFFSFLFRQPACAGKAQGAASDHCGMSLSKREVMPGGCWSDDGHLP